MHLYIYIYKSIEENNVINIILDKNTRVNAIIRNCEFQNVRIIHI